MTDSQYGGSVFFPAGYPPPLLGQAAQVQRYQGALMGGSHMPVFAPDGGIGGIIPFSKKKKEQGMLGTVFSDLKKFTVEHKSTIYWIALLVLIDHVCFQGKFRERLQGIMNKLLAKVEAAVGSDKS